MRSFNSIQIYSKMSIVQMIIKYSILPLHHSWVKRGETNTSELIWSLGKSKSIPSLEVVRSDSIRNTQHSDMSALVPALYIVCLLVQRAVTMATCQDRKCQPKLFWRSYLCTQKSRRERDGNAICTNGNLQCWLLVIWGYMRMDMNIWIITNVSSPL